MYSGAPNTQSGLSQKHVFPMNSPNCSHVSGGQAYGIIYSALDRLVILIIAQARKAGWQVGVTSVIFGSLEKVLHAFFSPDLRKLPRSQHSYWTGYTTPVQTMSRVRHLGPNEGLMPHYCKPTLFCSGLMLFLTGSGESRCCLRKLRRHPGACLQRGQ